MTCLFFTICQCWSSAWKLWGLNGICSIPERCSVLMLLHNYHPPALSSDMLSWIFSKVALPPTELLPNLGVLLDLYFLLKEQEGWVVYLCLMCQLHPIYGLGGPAYDHLCLGHFQVGLLQSSLFGATDHLCTEYSSSWFVHVTPLLYKLHRLPISYHLQFMMFVIIFKWHWARLFERAPYPEVSAHPTRLDVVVHFIFLLKCCHLVRLGSIPFL